MRMDLRETGREGVDLMYMTQVRDQWRAEQGNEHSGIIKSGKFLD
jgi:hypothetical protein